MIQDDFLNQEKEYFIIKNKDYRGRLNIISS